MSYDFKTQRANLFTERHYMAIPKTKANILFACATSGGVCTVDVAIRGTDDYSFVSLAAVDYLEEKGIIRLERHPDIATQNTVIRVLSRTGLQ